MTTPPNEPPSTPEGGDAAAPEPASPFGAAGGDTTPPPPPPPGVEGGATPPPPPPYGAEGGATPPPPPVAPPDGPFGGAPNPYQPGGQQPYSVGTALSWGWDRFKANPWPFVLMLLITFVASAVVSVPFGLATNVDSDSISADYAVGVGAGFSLLQSLGQLLSTLVGMVLSAAVVKGALDTTRGATVTLGSMFDNLPWLQVIIAGVLISIATTIGIILCVLPGLIVMFLTMWTNYFIIDRGEEAIQAIKSSYQLATSRLTDSLVAWIVTGLVALVGVCLCGVGMLATVPIALLALAWSFRTITGEQVA